MGLASKRPPELIKAGARRQFRFNQRANITSMETVTNDNATTAPVVERTLLAPEHLLLYWVRRPHRHR